MVAKNSPKGSLGHHAQGDALQVELSDLLKAADAAKGAIDASDIEDPINRARRSIFVLASGIEGFDKLPPDEQCKALLDAESTNPEALGVIGQLLRGFKNTVLARTL